MPTSIRHIAEKLKSFIADESFYTAALLVMVALASFGLGRQSVIETESEKTLENKASVVLAGATLPATTMAPTPLPSAFTVESGSEIEGSEEVVASKSGTKYHLPSCPGAKSIKPENLISFATRAEAEAAGYTPAANCKGLE